MSVSRSGLHSGGLHSAPASPGRTWRRAADLTREVLLTVAAVFGAICGVLIVLVVTLDLGVIVFRTGSMSPTIPTGSAALVRTMPADQVEIGDVVTVPSPIGPLPVTHRVVSTEQLADGQTRLHLRGDANDAEDPFPYDVTEVRRVIAHAPGVGFALVKLNNPMALGAITVLVAGLILWALWPSRPPDPPRMEEVQTTEQDQSRRRGTPVVTGVLVLLTAGALGLGPALGRADAITVPAPDPTSTTPPPQGYPQDDGILALSSSLPTGKDWSLSPGTDLLWRVTSAARPPAGADGAKGWLWVSVVAGGPLMELPDAITLTLELCDGGWAVDGSCPAGARNVPAPAQDGVVYLDREPVGQLSTGHPQQVAVRLQVADDLPNSAQGQDMYLGLRFDAFGDSIVIDDAGGTVPEGGEDPEPGSVTPGTTERADPGGLAITGADLRPVTWAVAGLLIGSVLLTIVRDRREQRRPRSDP